MGLVVTSKMSDEEREPIPPGNYFGVIIGLYDIGTQSGLYGAKHQIITITELHRERAVAADSKGRAFTIPTFYSLSFGSMNGKKSKLRSDVETLTGHVFSEEEAESSGFDIQGMLGLPYRLTIVEHVKPDGKKLGKITSIMALDDDDPQPKSEADETYYELDPSEPIPAAVPKWIAKMIEKSTEWVAAHGAPRSDANGNLKAALAAPKAAAAVDDDDVLY